MADMIAVEIEPVALPSSVNSDEARDFLDYLGIAATVMREQSGAGVATQNAAVTLARLRDTTTTTCEPLLARIAGRAAGAAQLMAPTSGGVLANISVFVPRRDAGILETMLIKEVEERARARWFAALSLHRPDTDGDVIPTADGEGAVPRDPQARALAESGYALEKVTRESVAGRDLEYLSAEWRKDLAG
jgi:hypothetical protein